MTLEKVLPGNPSSPKKALSDLVVLDLTHYVAGPYCTKLLADYGAEVIKVERPGIGDGARRIGPFPNDLPDPERSGLFLHLNTNKMGITLNLKAALGKMILLKLIMRADILVENFEPRVMPSLGFAYDELEKLNPRLVMTSVSNFGQTGPYRDYRASEITAFAMTGRMYRVGLEKREPVRYAEHMLQYFAGAAAASATMCAVIGAKLRGSGQHVDVSLIESLMGSVDSRLLRFPYTHRPPRREGAGRLGAFLRGVYPCKDGFIAISGNHERQWARLVQMLGKPELLHDPRFATTEARLQHADEFEAIFLPWLVERTKSEIFRLAQRHRVIVTPVYTTAELLEDPQYRARGFFVEVEHPVAGRFQYPGAPFRMAESPWQVRRPAPLLGQDNEEIYCRQLGYSREDLVRLRQLGVI
ncbi:MAG: CoA transferase [Chloroflexi bacterium]|nr:CoA transferase [Chloroflexota bacterium]